MFGKKIVSDFNHITIKEIVFVRPLPRAARCTLHASFPARGAAWVQSRRDVWANKTPAAARLRAHNRQHDDSVGFWFRNYQKSRKKVFGKVLGARPLEEKGNPCACGGSRSSVARPAVGYGAAGLTHPTKKNRSMRNHAAASNERRLEVHCGAVVATFKRRYRRWPAERGTYAFLAERLQQYCAAGGGLRHCAPDPPTNRMNRIRIVGWVEPSARLRASATRYGETHQIDRPANPIVGYGNTGLRLALSSAALALLVSAIGQPISARAGAADDLMSVAAVGSAQAVDHHAWDRLLKTYVKPGSDGLNRVDYAALKSQGRDMLKAYVRGLEQIDHRQSRPAPSSSRSSPISTMPRRWRSLPTDIRSNRSRTFHSAATSSHGSREGHGRPRCSRSAALN